MIKPTLEQARIRRALLSWVGLNELIAGASENEARQLLEAELAGKARKQFVLRIHSRLNKMRAHAERNELLKKIGEK